MNDKKGGKKWLAVFAQFYRNFDLNSWIVPGATWRTDGDQSAQVSPPGGNFQKIWAKPFQNAD
jgi:hypothetical protein